MHAPPIAPAHHPRRADIEASRWAAEPPSKDGLAAAYRFEPDQVSSTAEGRVRWAATRAAARRRGGAEGQAARGAGASCMPLMPAPLMRRVRTPEQQGLARTSPPTPPRAGPREGPARPQPAAPGRRRPRLGLLHRAAGRRRRPARAAAHARRRRPRALAVRPAGAAGRGGAGEGREPGACNCWLGAGPPAAACTAAGAASAWSAACASQH